MTIVWRMSERTKVARWRSFIGTGWAWRTWWSRISSWLTREYSLVRHLEIVACKKERMNKRETFRKKVQVTALLSKIKVISLRMKIGKDLREKCLKIC